MTYMDGASLEWFAQVPYSRVFEDIYFQNNGFHESYHCFFRGLGLPDHLKHRDCYILAELGFGTGLNFFTLWYYWKWYSSFYPESSIRYIAIEKFPLSTLQMARIFSSFPHLVPLVHQFFLQFPEKIEEGTHLLKFPEDRLELLLLWGDVENKIKNIPFLVDGWYLDGFSARKNPEMWSFSTLSQVAACSSPSFSRIATFSTAPSLCTHLENLGYCVEKVVGYGKKKYCLRAVRQVEPV